MTFENAKGRIFVVATCSISFCSLPTNVRVFFFLNILTLMANSVRTDDNFLFVGALAAECGGDRGEEDGGDRRGAGDRGGQAERPAHRDAHGRRGHPHGQQEQHPEPPLHEPQPVRLIDLTD